MADQFHCHGCGYAPVTVLPYCDQCWDKCAVIERNRTARLTAELDKSDRDLMQKDPG
jgi:hypothetical protein